MRFLILKSLKNSPQLYKISILYNCLCITISSFYTEKSKKRRSSIFNKRSKEVLLYYLVSTLHFSFNMRLLRVREFFPFIIASTFLFYKFIINSIESGCVIVLFNTDDYIKLTRTLVDHSYVHSVIGER